MTTGRPAARLAGAVDKRLHAWASERVAERLWEKDGGLWGAAGKRPDELAAWLGWLDLPERSAQRVGELTHLADSIWRDGYTRAAVLGMGGSSLAPELLSRVIETPAEVPGDASGKARGVELR